MTIIDACVKILQESGKPMSADDIFTAVQQSDLYKFGAKDPKAILRGTLRKHVRGTSGKKIREVSSGVYSTA